MLPSLGSSRDRPAYARVDRIFPDVSRSPIPEWRLIRLDDYDAISIQFSRGCPFDCEFCDIIVMNGRKPRVKLRDQVHAELQALHDAGWRRSIFIADDNFYGNKKRCRELLDAMVAWRDAHDRPFVFATQASLNIAELQEYRPAEIFRDAKGKAVPAGHYSMLVSTIFQSPERTLRDEELHAWSTSIVTALESLGGRLRA